LAACPALYGRITLQTTLKYVLLILRADNKGEGGTFALYALVRRRRKWLVFPAMIGGAALLADGIITPPISITSAIEGLKTIPVFHDISVKHHHDNSAGDTSYLFLFTAIRYRFYWQVVRACNVRLVYHDSNNGLCASGR
jgi:hypothetical protein